MLLEPLEERLDPSSIDRAGVGDRDPREGVGRERRCLAGFGVLELEAGTWRVELLARARTREPNSLIADRPRQNAMERKDV